VLGGHDETQALLHHHNQEGSAYSTDMLNKGMIHILVWMEWDGTLRKMCNLKLTVSFWDFSI
jgi:hypothetical protein